MRQLLFILREITLRGLFVFLMVAGPAVSAADVERPQPPAEERQTEEPQQPDEKQQTEQSPQPEDWQRRLEMLRSVPYLGYAPAADRDTLRGVVLHDPGRAWWGYNFYSTWATGEAYLIDMEGVAVHRWTFWPEQRNNPDYAFLLPGGDLLVIHEYTRLKRIGWDSEVLWQKEMKAHHDALLAPDGTLWVIVRSLKTYRGRRVWFDDLIHLDRYGEELDRWSTFDHLGALRRALDARSFLDTALDSLAGGSSGRQAGGLQADGKPEDGSIAAADRLKDASRDWPAGARPEEPSAPGDERRERTSRVRPGAGRRELDYFHINTVGLLPDTPLGRSDDRFRAGNLLICLRNVNQIAVLDPETGRIRWAWGEGELEWPHHPTMLDEGHILLFDNGVHRGYSRVVEVDPGSGEIVWEYRADPPESFYSHGRGSAQRFSNGNTLICESDQGRAFEITPRGETVWSWWNPLIKGDRHGTVYRMIRWPAGVIEPLLERWSADESN